MPAAKLRWDDGDSDFSFVVASITGTGAVATDLQTRISAAVCSVQNSPAALPTDSSSVTVIAAPNVTVVITEHAAAANAVEGAALNIAVLAKGQR